MAGAPSEARLLKQAREGLEWSIRRAARQAQVSEGTWRKYESPDACMRTSDTLASMAQAVGVTPVELHEADRDDAALHLQSLPRPAPDAANLAERLAYALSDLRRAEREIEAVRLLMARSPQ